ncbi:MAG: hypothetical protein JXR96_15265 [Deltaproteobacteria bacterium]|nr:hypothetical protein [Deltaproteobacteria bacterium]
MRVLAHGMACLLLCLVAFHFGACDNEKCEVFDDCSALQDSYLAELHTTTDTCGGSAYESPHLSLPAITDGVFDLYVECEETGPRVIIRTDELVVELPVSLCKADNGASFSGMVMEKEFTEMHVRYELRGRFEAQSTELPADGGVADGGSSVPLPTKYEMSARLKAHYINNEDFEKNCDVDGQISAISF